jgi:hypothetical protein
MNMTFPEPIGGYFELELPKPRPWLHSGAIHLNSGRSALEYILRALKPSLIHIPRFTCDVLLEPIHRTGTDYRFYSITSELEIDSKISPNQGEILLYTNYFGVKDAYCLKLAEMYGSRLVLDFSQALFTPPPAGVHTFYSPRKFVGVPDGGCLYTSAILTEELRRDISLHRYTHLIGRRDLGADAAYNYFKANDDSLVGEAIKMMSASTERLLSSINFDQVLSTRRENFTFLHQALGASNRLRIDLAAAFGPLIYPFLCNNSELRTTLVRNKIFVATYWHNVFEWCDESSYEWHLATYLIPIPIDHRYDTRDMENILKYFR